MAAARPLAPREPDLADLRVLVVGLGKSGLAAARFAAARGARVVVCDRASAGALEAAAAEAARQGIEVRAGGQPPELAAAADLVLLSPGVDPAIPLVAAARQAGLPVWGEVELAARFCRGRVLAVTGSNGKSTVTSMAGAILRRAGLRGGTGGNLDVPFTELLADDDPQAVHAVELSSFQLETLESLRPAVAVIVNLSPDHLDRHGSYSAYAAAKGHLLALQDASGYAVLNADDRQSDRFLPLVRGHLARFSTRGPVDSGAGLDRGQLVLRLAGREEPLLAAEALGVVGEHNVANALAAGLACRLIGCSAAAVAAGLAAYRALPHRLEWVARIRGVEFYNDSKATNPASTSRALAAFEAGRVHLILGGRDKGVDWSEVVALVRERVRRVLLVGEAAELLRQHLAGVVETIDCGDVPAAAAAGLAGAAPGQVVLLAPGCASYDQYRNFEERGEDFRAAVLRLASEAGDA